MKTIRINIKILIFIFSLLIIEASHTFAQQDTNCKISKRIGSVIYEPVGVVKMESDSTLFDGYLVFELHKNPDKNFDIGDTTLAIIETFFLKDLSSINSIKDRIFYNQCFLKYAYGDSFTYDTGYAWHEGVVKAIDTTNENYIKLKKFYRKYRDGIVWIWLENYFLIGEMTSSIFDTSHAKLVELKKNNFAYYIFKVRVYGGLLKYKSEVFFPGRNSREESYVHFEERNFFLPNKRATIFKAVDEYTLLKNGFTKSDWFPDYLYKKCN